MKLETQEVGREPIPVARKLEGMILGWMVVVLLLAGCLLVLRPFFSAVLWAVVLCFSTWPIYRRLLKMMGNRRTLAALVMSLGMMLIVLVPFVIIGATLADNVKALTAAVQHWIGQGPPAPPAWLERVPAIGPEASEYWRSLEADTAKLWAGVQPYIEKVTGWLLVFGLALGRGVLELALSIFVAFFLFRDGLVAAERLTAGVERIAGERGKHLLEVAGNTVRGVVYGILGTALAQAIMSGVGFAHRGCAGRRAAGIDHVLRIRGPDRGDGAGVGAGGAVALSYGRNGLGYLHAYLGPGGGQH